MYTQFDYIYLAELYMRRVTKLKKYFRVKHVILNINTMLIFLFLSVNKKPTKEGPSTVYTLNTPF